MRRQGFPLTSGLAGLVLAACAGEPAVPASALGTINEGDVASHIRVLASDSFEGRRPSSAGEDATVRYLIDQFERFGLRPGNGDAYVQEVPLVSITTDPDARLLVHGPAGTRRFRYGSDVMAWTKRVVEEVTVEASEMVFVGYGIVAPEYGWDDYAALDVRGKTVVLLVNDPGFATGDTALFTGEAMTYYGRWTYKYEEAARQGAAAALIVHETAPAGYPWDVVAGSWSGPQFDLVAEDRNMSRVAVEGWLTLDVARSLFREAGLAYDSLKAQAAEREFHPVPLGLTASVSLRNRVERSSSRNVVARLPGRVRPDEAVLYLAHWDHLGRDPTRSGDRIYNGALDNASGTAGLLELAEAFASLARPPERSVVFLATTAEEQGLLGSLHYARNPLYPLVKTAAAINMDGMNIWGPMRDITVIGYGQSELDRYLERAAAGQGRQVRPDPEPEKGFYYRSDHFSLAKVGVPALYSDAGIAHLEHGEAWALERRDEYTAEHYHKPGDEYEADWDLSGAVDDLRLLFRVGYRVANEATFPEWSADSPFRAIRDSLGQVEGDGDGTRR